MSSSTSRKTCLALRHLAFEDLGLLEPLLREVGYDVSYREAGVDRISADEWRSVDLVVVLGGPVGVYEVEDYPWLNDEIEGLRQRLQLSRPTLGFCLGAQLMAAAMGARVYAGHGKEIGWGGLSLTSAGNESSLRHLNGAPVLHWHGDTFDIPAGATLLASSQAYPSQAFSVGHQMLALQFHLEVDPCHMERWLIGHTGELRQAGLSIVQLRARTVEIAAQVTQAGQRVLRAWLDQLDR